MASKDDLVAEALRITSLYAEAEELKQQAGRAVTAFAELVEVWFDDASRREVLDLVHHRTYERRGQEYASDVIALCRQCHSRFHGAGS